jgi:hypothetical protein
MSDSAEFGICPYCKKETQLERTYFRYDIKCECHSPTHFEIVWHCKDCKPIEPIETRITVRTKNLSKRRIKLEKINESSL